MNFEVRHARASDLSSLVALFAACEVSDLVAVELRPLLWKTMCDRPGLSLFVAVKRENIIATCTLITTPNLIREGRQHAFLENVMTHPDERGHGAGRAVVGAALRQAWRENCHHVLLQSGRADPRVHHFYKSVGFESDVRVAYVANRPDRV